MRLWLTAGTLAALLPGGAMGASTEEQYQAALSAFTAGIEDGTFAAEYPKIVLDNLEGTWYQRSLLSADKADQACSQVPIAIRSIDEYSFSLTRSAGTRTERTLIFTARGGNIFTRTADLTAFMKALHGDREFTDEQEYAAYRSVTGTSYVNRPSEDILVMQDESLWPSIIARCPEDS